MNQSAAHPVPDFKVLFESVPGLYLVLSPDLTIIAASDAYLRATRTRREDVLGRGLFEAFPEKPGAPDAAPWRDLKASLERVIRNRAPDAMPVQKRDVPRLESEGGVEERFWSPVNYPLFAADGKLSCIFHRVEDVSESARLKEQLGGVNEELSAFSYSVSHDLRAPLRALDGFSLALLEDYAGRLDETGKNYLQRIRMASQRMGQLIEDLLALSRISRAEVKRETVDLSALAHEVAGGLSKGEPGRQVAFVIGDGLTAQGDKILFKNALENLMGNAWKFTSKKEKATIEFGSLEQDGKRVYFVRDDGAGFNMEYAGRLFGAFQRLHQQAEFPGTGIGLAAVQRILRRLGGRVWAEGAVGRGATFYFSLG